MAKVTTESATASEYVAHEGILAKLSLKDIELDPVADVRKQYKLDADEKFRIDALAKSIYEQGQIQPVLVRRNGADGKYKLIAGRRRLAACQLLEQQLSEVQKMRVEYPIQAYVVEKDDEGAWLASITENLQRKQFSPIELALNIKEIRERKGFDGPDWSDKVAKFLHVSRAQVTQHMKLLDLPKEIRDKVHKGMLSAQSAIDLHAVDESRREEVLARAEELAEEETAAKPTPKPKAKGAKAEAEPEEEKGKIKRKHVLEAARQADALTQAKPRTRNELLAFWQTIIDSTDPYPQPITDFARVYVERWATGKIGDRALMNKLDAIGELIEGKQTPRRKSA